MSDPNRMSHEMDTFALLAYQAETIQRMQKGQYAVARPTRFDHSWDGPLTNAIIDEVFKAFRLRKTHGTLYLKTFPPSWLELARLAFPSPTTGTRPHDIGFNDWTLGGCAQTVLVEGLRARLGRLVKPALQALDRILWGDVR